MDVNYTSNTINNSELKRNTYFIKSDKNSKSNNLNYNSINNNNNFLKNNTDSVATKLTSKINKSYKDDSNNNLILTLVNNLTLKNKEFKDFPSNLNDLYFEINNKLKSYTKSFNINSNNHNIKDNFTKLFSLLDFLHIPNEFKEKLIHSDDDIIVVTHIFSNEVSSNIKNIKSLKNEIYNIADISFVKYKLLDQILNISDNGFGEYSQCIWDDFTEQNYNSNIKYDTNNNFDLKTENDNNDTFLIASNCIVEMLGCLTYNNAICKKNNTKYIFLNFDLYKAVKLYRYDIVYLILFLSSTIIINSLFDYNLVDYLKNESNTYTSNDDSKNTSKDNLVFPLCKDLFKKLNDSNRMCFNNNSYNNCAYIFYCFNEYLETIFNVSKKYY